MALTLYLAMTAAEIQNCPTPPAHMAWMACHFSPYSSGISNVPQLLPEGSVLILNDRIPPQGHDPALVAGQLAEAAEQLGVCRVLLDFQRVGDPLTAKIAAAVVEALPCPVGVTAGYAAALACPVFLMPLLHKPLAEQLKSWPGREVWLDAALDCQEAVVTENGCGFTTGCWREDLPYCHEDSQLHCRYRIAVEEECARFTLWRGRQELQALLDEGERLGVGCAIGLYQQLGKT